MGRSRFCHTQPSMFQLMCVVAASRQSTTVVMHCFKGQTRSTHPCRLVRQLKAVAVPSEVNIDMQDSQDLRRQLAQAHHEVAELKEALKQARRDIAKMQKALKQERVDKLDKEHSDALDVSPLSAAMNADMSFSSGLDGMTLAAVRIQAFWRGVKARAAVISVRADRLSEEQTEPTSPCADYSSDEEASEYERGDVFPPVQQIQAALTGPVLVHPVPEHLREEAARIAWSRIGKGGDGSERPTTDEENEEIQHYFDTKVTVLVAQRVLGMASYFVDLSGHVLVLDEVASFQGFKTGTPLVAEIIKRCPSARLAILLARRQAVTFYKALGFEVICFKRGPTLLSQRKQLQALFASALLPEPERLEKFVTGYARSIGFNLPLMLRVL